RDALERSSKQMLGNLLNEAQKELEVIGVSNTSLNRLIHFARQEGALGAKLTGAGHGGCMIALAKNESHATLLGEKLKQFGRSEEHTSELQSRFDIVCRLLLEKKNSI